MEKTQGLDSRVVIKKLRLTRGGFFSIQAPDSKGNLTKYVFFNSIYLPTGTYKNLKINFAPEIHLKISSEELKELPIKLQELREGIFKYEKESGDTFFVVLYEAPKAPEINLEGTLRTDFDTQIMKSLFGKPLVKKFILH